LKSLVREDPTIPGGYVKAPWEEAAVVQMFREEQPVTVRPFMALRSGDVIETGADGAAIIHFKKLGDVILASNTRVRIGSLEVLFGRIFAKIKGFFSVETHEVVAGVEGTEFILEFRDQTVRVIVIKDAVTCRSRGSKWPVIRVHQGNELSVTPATAAPATRLASKSEMNDLGSWVRRVESERPPPPPQIYIGQTFGYCCEKGQVRPASASECGGVFHKSEEGAHHACTAGWCCAGGSVTTATRSQCEASGGKFFADSEKARSACSSVKTGWCCTGGKVQNMTDYQCGASDGQFFSDWNTAQNACTHHTTQQMVWCCYLPPNNKEGQGTVVYESPTSCQGKKGKPFPDEKTAKNQCVRIN
jgi:hypothetical protein